MKRLAVKDDDIATLYLYQFAFRHWDQFGLLSAQRSFLTQWRQQPPVIAGEKTDRAILGIGAVYGHQN